MTPYGKTDLKENPGGGTDFVIRITWPREVHDRRLIWYAFQTGGNY